MAPTAAPAKLPALLHYDAACRALAEAKAVDEVKEILDAGAALRTYARQARNRELEADAVEIRMRATRRLDQLRQAQKQTIGLATGGEYGGRAGIDGVRATPSIVRPTLAMQGVDKNLAKAARTLGGLSEQRFERAVADARDSVTRAFKTVVNAAAIAQERESYAARVHGGGTIADLQALAASGYRAGGILIDFAWTFRTYGDRGKQRSPERRYDCMSLDEMKALPIPALAAPDCALFVWSVWPALPDALEVIGSWGSDFKYSTAAFIWVKTCPSAEHVALDGSGLHWGMGYHTRSNTEPCLLVLRGAPLRLAKDVHQVVVAPVGEHSAKPDAVARRIAQLYPGPYLELFARRRRAGWTCWGNELEQIDGAVGAAEADQQPNGVTSKR